MVTKVTSVMTDGAATDPTTKPGSASANKVAVLNADGNLDDFYLPIYVSQWRLTADTAITASEAVVTGAWEEADTTLQGTGIGSNLTQSSGVFTLPLTGIWLVEFCGRVNRASSDVAAITAHLYGTSGSGGSTEVELAQSWASVSTTATDASLCMSTMIDVTATADNKIKLKVSASGTGASLKSSTTLNASYFTFTRIGST